MTKGFEVRKFMTVDMGLSGNNLVVYAFLWNETNGGTKTYTDGYMRISEAAGVTIPTVYNVLEKLRSRGAISYDNLQDGIEIVKQF
jgi:Fe2+ or Zn2+ uptake regulation protein